MGGTTQSARRSRRVYAKAKSSLTVIYLVVRTIDALQGANTTLLPAICLTSDLSIFSGSLPIPLNLVL